MADLYGVGSGGNLNLIGEYKAGAADEIDAKIRNMPMVVDHVYKKAVELLNAVGSNNFEIVLSTEHGGEVSHQEGAAMSNRTHMARKMVWDQGSRQWGSGMASSSHGPEKQRPRAYVTNANPQGYHEELTEAVLLKAAMGMSGK